MLRGRRACRGFRALALVGEGTASTKSPRQDRGWRTPVRALRTQGPPCSVSEGRNRRRSRGGGWPASPSTVGHGSERRAYPWAMQATDFCRKGRMARFLFQNIAMGLPVCELLRTGFSHCMSPPWPGDCTGGHGPLVPCLPSVNPMLCLPSPPPPPALGPGG